MKITKKDRVGFINEKLEAYKQLIIGDEYAIKFLQEVKIPEAEKSIDELVAKEKPTGQDKEILNGTRAMYTSMMVDIEEKKGNIKNYKQMVELLEKDLSELSK